MANPLQPRNPDLQPLAASVIMLRRDTVLMVLRLRPPFENLSGSFPGGRAEPGEEAETTARRELLEETGIAAADLVPVGALHPAPDLSPLLLNVFAARGGAAEPVAGDDALRAEYVPLCAVTTLPLTAGAVGWLSRAVLALCEPPLR